MPMEYRHCLNEIEATLRKKDFVFDLDLSLTVGGDIVEVTHPTGLRNPRIVVDKRLAKGAIFVNNQDIANVTDHGRFLRETIHVACLEIIERIAKKAVDFVESEERRKFDFLLET